MLSLEKICEIYKIDSQKVLKFREKLTRWAQSINLVSKETLVDFNRRHLLDSAQLTLYLHPQDHILDIGSGAGFPGLILAFAGYNVTLVEQNPKKCIFLKHILSETSTSAVVLSMDAYLIKGRFDCIVSRAFSSLTHLLEIQSHVSRETTRGIYLKGRSYSREIEEAQSQWNFTYETTASLSDPEGKILFIRDLSSKLLLPKGGHK